MYTLMKNIFSILLLLFISISYSQVRFEGIITDSEGNTIMGANVNHYLKVVHYAILASRFDAR